MVEEEIGMLRVITASRGDEFGTVGLVGVGIIDGDGAVAGGDKLKPKPRLRVDLSDWVEAHL